MKKRFKFKTLILFLTILMCIPLTVMSHSGRTDANGGHRDNKNKSGLGSYHYHCGGYPAHLHPNGVCPYKSTNTTATNNSASSSKSASSSTSSGTTTTHHSNTGTYYEPPKPNKKMYTSIYNGEINGGVTPLFNIPGEKEYYTTVYYLEKAGYDINVVNEWNTIYISKGNRTPESLEFYPEYKGIYCDEVVNPNYAIRLVGNGFNYNVKFVCSKTTNEAFIPFSELKCFGIK